MTKKIYLETFEKCPGSLCFSILLLFQIPSNFYTEAANGGVL